MRKNAGMTLVEILVGIIIGTLVCAIAFYFYRHFMGHMERQKRVTSLQGNIRNAVDCINRYLVAGGVSGDSLFFDPHRKLTAPFVNGGHRVFEVSPDSATLSVYGNYSGSAASIAAPVVNKGQRWLKTDKAGLFKAGGYAYIYAGSAQEVLRVASIQDSILTVEDNFFAFYPKGTLIFPLERIRVSRDGKATLKVSRESANGSPIFVRDFMPTNNPGDSLEFKVTSVDRQAGQLGYSLTFAATARGLKAALVRKSDQTVFARGF